MRFSLRVVLLAITATAGVSGYLRWQVEEERRDKIRYEQPGPVEDRKYWPPPATKLVTMIEERFGPRESLRLYRNLYNRRYGITDCFIQFDIAPEDYEALVTKLKIEPLRPNDRNVARFWRKAPADWLTPEQVPEAVLHGVPYIRGGHMGSQAYVLYDASRQTASMRYVYDY